MLRQLGNSFTLVLRDSRVLCICFTRNESGGLKLHSIQASQPVHQFPIWHSMSVVCDVYVLGNQSVYQSEGVNCDGIDTFSNKTKTDLVQSYCLDSH